jgi:hypothetical protein
LGGIGIFLITEKVKFIKPKPATDEHQQQQHPAAPNTPTHSTQHTAAAAGPGTAKSLKEDPIRHEIIRSEKRRQKRLQKSSSYRIS